MLIKKLKIENFRNLASVEIAPHQGLNVIFGDNGAGKTSVLESLVVLARGRSFRTTKAGELSGSNGPAFRVFAEVEDARKAVHRLGIERSGKFWRARKDGKDLSQLSQLTRSLPLVLMEPNSHLLISGPPETRRRFLDWGMFHVKHGFLDAWRRYSKILKQRNAALRQRRTEVLEDIDEVLIEAGLKLGKLRKSHAEQVSGRLQALMDELDSDIGGLRLEYRAGWSGDSLREALTAGRQGDLERGATGCGPHRADLALFCGKAPARGILSRGEQKLLAAALLLSQADILAVRGEPPVMLLDDLASEFDDRHFRSVLGRALKNGSQVWISGTQKPEIDQNHVMFHVEHGVLSEVV